MKPANFELEFVKLQYVFLIYIHFHLHIFLADPLKLNYN